MSKGVHVLVQNDERWAAALTVPQDDVRVTFAVPWYGMLLLGTTDTEYDGDPGAVAVEPTDVATVLDEAQVALGGELARPERVRASFAGLRVLPAGPGESASARRETVFSIGRGGMVSVAGGKLTTYRRIALDALARLGPVLGELRLDRRPWPLPDAVDGALRLPVDVPPELRDHLVHLYGRRAGEVLAPAVDDSSLLEPLHPDGPDIAAQARFAREAEWALTDDDVFLRRTTVGWRGLWTGEGEASLAATPATPAPRPRAPGSAR